VVEGLDLSTREADQRVRRAERGAEREELLAGLEGLEAWYRDLVVVSAGAEAAVVHADRIEELREDVALGLGEGPVAAAEAVRETWRALEEFNLNPSLALEALFILVHRELRSGVRAA
jgi:DNA polymerase-3 subunit delta'